MNLGVTEAWSLRLADSERHLLEGAALARRIGRPYLEVSCLAHLGFASTVHSFAVARQRCEDAIALAARYGWEADPVTAPALAALANALTWTGQFEQGERWLDRARRATQVDGEPGIRLLVCLTSAILQANMVGEHVLTSRVTAWTIATRARPEIAAELSVSLNTVSTHIRRIYAKLGVVDRSSAVRRGRELRLLSAAAPERRKITESR